MKVQSTTPRDGGGEVVERSSTRSGASTGPRLLSAQAAASYLGFRSTEVLKGIPVKPLHLTGAGVGKSARWDLRALDAWLDKVSGLFQRSGACDEAQSEFDAWRAGREARTA